MLDVSLRSLEQEFLLSQASLHFAAKMVYVRARMRFRQTGFCYDPGVVWQFYSFWHLEALNARLERTKLIML